MSDSLRNLRALRKDAIEPGEFVLIDCGIMIIVAFLEYLIIERMVHYLKAHIYDTVVLLFGRRQKADISISRLQVDTIRLCRI